MYICSSFIVGFPISYFLHNTYGVFIRSLWDLEQMVYAT